MAKSPETVKTDDKKIETENQEPENSALEARRKAAEAARIKSQVRVQPAKVGTESTEK